MRKGLIPFALTATLLTIFMAGCGMRDIDELDMARAPVDPLVYDDDFGPDVYPQPFSGTDPDALTQDGANPYSGTRAIKIAVPAQGSELGGYAGGVLTAVGVRDMTDFNALTFYARSSVASSFDVLGIGNDNTGTSKFDAARLGVPLSESWTFVVVPIPDADKLTAERGLFTFAEGFEAGHPEGHSVWLDEIRYANLGNVTDPRPAMASLNKQYFVGAVAQLDSVRTTFDVDGADVVVYHQPGYFDFEFSAPAVAAYQNGRIIATGPGETQIAASLKGVPVPQSASMTVFAAPPGPPVAPTLPAGDVISMFCGEYTDVPVDSWNPHWQWSTAELADYSVDGDAAKMYSFLNFVGITFDTAPIDASAMTHLHLDVYAPVGTDFRVKIVSTGSDPELEFDAASDPAFVAGQWSYLEIPLTMFQPQPNWSHVYQLVLSTDDAQLVLVDNVYWHK